MGRRAARKPFYKEIDRTTLADIAPIEVAGWAAEAEQFFHNRHLNDLREANYQPSPTRWKIPKPDPELLPAVKKYLEVRKEVDARREAAKVFPNLSGSGFNMIDESIMPIERVEPSRRDVLLQLFSERSIGLGQLHAGRRWQAWRECATIQPNMTIDWSSSVSRMHYQKRGDLTEGQYGAMKQRRLFHNYAGGAAVSFLDFCLDADRGDAEIMATLGANKAQLVAIFRDLLTKVCECFSIKSAQRTSAWHNAG